LAFTWIYIMVQNFRAATVISGLKLSAGRSALMLFLATSAAVITVPAVSMAQVYTFSNVAVDGNQRIETGTILSYAALTTGTSLSAAQLNDAYQRVLASGLFETVEFLPQGGRLVIQVVEYPTISRISIEGNDRLDDETITAALLSKPRLVFSPATAELDAANITEAYQVQGRLAATVEPRIIRRSGNRVDLVFEITEGKEVEIERLSFVGNRTYPDRRLRRVLQSKQAGLLRALVRRDTFSADQIEFDKRVLSDFYQSRGFVDFQVLSVSSEVARERDGFFVTFNIREGQIFKFGEITTVSEISEVSEADTAEFASAAKAKSGQTYSPSRMEDTISRMERLATAKGLAFVRVEPRVTRNEEDLTLDVEFALVRGDRVFVERIDIEGNATTLDRVVRKQFRTVEGDPFNPREIREAAERIRALGFFSSADVNTRPGSASDQVIVDVDVVEAPTGSFTFGANYSVSGGVGLVASFSERNFLGRGQTFNFSLNASADDGAFNFKFVEPAFLGRDLAFSLSSYYTQSSYSYTAYDTTRLGIQPGFGFPVSQNARLSVNYLLSQDEVSGVDAGSSALLRADQALGAQLTSAAGYKYSFDNRRSGLNPNAGFVFRFSQQYAGLGGDTEYLKSTALAAAETKVFNDQITLRATLEGGAQQSFSGDSRVIDRFNLGSSQMRGFEPSGIGPRDGADALGGNFYAVAKFETDFPLGLPEEYGIKGGVFMDFGSVWGLDTTPAGTDDGFNLRSVVGATIFWTTPIGPLRFNFTRALQKEDYDEEQTFDLTISTQF
jgi:outer membrane protein insertion porin family